MHDTENGVSLHGMSLHVSIIQSQEVQLRETRRGPHLMLQDGHE